MAIIPQKLRLFLKIDSGNYVKTMKLLFFLYRKEI